ncbi:MAG: phosphoglycerate kinase [archaeon]|nr:phosphoglycerate kinase [archaeon]
MKLKTLDNFDFREKKVLLRIDINSPIVNGKVLDSPRFKESTETINELSKKGARIVIIAHQGRKGKSDFLSLNQHARLLSRYTNKKVQYVNYLFNSFAINKINSLNNGEILLLKNVRDFEDEINPKLKTNHYKEFCKNFDIYVNDAFPASHRTHGSIVIPPKILPSCMGRAFEKELIALKNFHLKTSKKIAFLLGGSKAEDYLPLFSILKNKHNKILVSGVFANLILVAKGHNLGYETKWLKEQGYNSLIPKLKTLCKKYEKQIILPTDFAVNGIQPEKAKKRIVKSLDEAPFNQKIWDVDKNTVNLFKENLRGMDSIFMKGPLGYSEISQFSNSTIDILKFLSNFSRKKNTFTLLGGGHLSTTIQKYNIPNTFSHISTSGGALIAYLSGEKLPGIEALEKSTKSK